jgi:D-tagatose-bisphosphate aldolase class II non-catalytic subunit
MTRALRDIVADNRRGIRHGIPSYCTAHPDVLRAILRCYRDDDAPILIEATCNQVNQFGGYTGMQPVDFRSFIHGLAAETGIDTARIILGGDHLGPNPWKKERAEVAMARAAELVRGYVQAGFSKIHLDASMACADDAGLDVTEIARRAAALCRVAEDAAEGRALAYVIGTEVPTPGGETETIDHLAVTDPGSVAAVLDAHRQAFAAQGLEEALARVIGIVVQPGVDFGNNQVVAFDRSKAGGLSGALNGFAGIVFEAHSTDYQSGTALADLVDCHFAILKVGPELTTAYREAVVAMAQIESWLPGAPSNILAVLQQVMESDPRHWIDYIANDNRAAAMRIFGLSDRLRYYWPQPAIQDALRHLRANIDAAEPEIGLLTQYVGGAEQRDGLSTSEATIQAKVGAVVARYRAACNAVMPFAAAPARRRSAFGRRGGGS